MRDCTKALIIKHADKIGTTHISLEVANEGIEQAKGYMEEAMKTGNLKDMIANLTGKASGSSKGMKPGFSDLQVRRSQERWGPFSNSSRNS